MRQAFLTAKAGGVCKARGALRVSCCETAAPYIPPLLLSLPQSLPRHLGRYVFLVDAQGRLRWRGSGSPSEHELQTLLRCTEELLEQR